MKGVNRHRSCRFGRALRAYDTAFDPTDCLVDLLADARHRCDRHGHRYVEFDCMAFRHFLEESVAAIRESLRDELLRD